MPDAIQAAWENRAALPMFEERCAHLVETYRLAAELYRGDSKGEDARYEPEENQYM